MERARNSPPEKRRCVSSSQVSCQWFSRLSGSGTSRLRLWIRLSLPYLNPPTAPCSNDSRSFILGAEVAPAQGDNLGPLDLATFEGRHGLIRCNISVTLSIITSFGFNDKYKNKYRKRDSILLRNMRCTTEFLATLATCGDPPAVSCSLSALTGRTSCHMGETICWDV